MQTSAGPLASVRLSLSAASEPRRPEPQASEGPAFEDSSAAPEDPPVAPRDSPAAPGPAQGRRRPPPVLIPDPQLRRSPSPAKRRSPTCDAAPGNCLSTGKKARADEALLVPGSILAEATRAEERPEEGTVSAGAASASASALSAATSPPSVSDRAPRPAHELAQASLPHAHSASAREPSSAAHDPSQQTDSPVSLLASLSADYTCTICQVCLKGRAEGGGMRSRGFAVGGVADSRALAVVSPLPCNARWEALPYHFQTPYLRPYPKIFSLST